MVKSGDLVKVKVLEVDLPRKRIALSMRLSEPATPRADGAHGKRGESAGREPQRSNQRADQRRQPQAPRRPSDDRRHPPTRRPPEQSPPPANSAFAAAFEKAKKGSAPGPRVDAPRLSTLPNVVAAVVVVVVVVIVIVIVIVIGEAMQFGVGENPGRCD